MSRRPITDRVTCAKPGCPEVVHFEYGSQRERVAAAKRRVDDPWRCTRHSDEDAVLSRTNRERTHVLTATALPPAPGLYWVEEGRSSGSGFTFGPGYKAFANDFPAGTQVVVSARLVLPEDGA